MAQDTGRDATIVLMLILSRSFVPLCSCLVTRGILITRLPSVDGYDPRLLPHLRLLLYHDTRRRGQARHVCVLIGCSNPYLNRRH